MERGVPLENLKRFQAKWKPVRIKKTRQIRKLEPRFDSIETEKALDREALSRVGRDPLRLARRRGAPREDLFGSQLPEDGREERTPRLFGLAAARQPLRYLQKHLGGAMIGGDFRDHLAVVGSHAEQS